ncbi:GGDEF domain-containing protein [Colwellia sp. 12G3]|nr:GGDEF domain-containing protein [Colwellia sp. 12G3]
MSHLKAISPLFVYFFITFRLLLLCLLLTSANSIGASEQKPHLADALIISNDIAKKFKLADDSRLSDPTLFRQLLKELNQQSADFTPAHRQFLNYLQGYHFAYIGEHDKAEKKLKAILHSSSDIQLKFRANHTLINLSAINHKWADGLQYIAENNLIINKITDNSVIQNSLLATVIFYISIKKYDFALEHIAQLELHDLSPHKRCFAKQYYLEAKFNLGQLKVNSPAISDALKLCITSKNNIGSNAIRRHQAKLYLQSNAPEQALNLLLPYADEVQSTLFPMLIAAIDNVIAQAYFQLNDMENAKYYATKAMLLNKGNTGVERGRDSYRVLFQVAEKQNNPTLALRYFKQYAQFDKAFINEVKAKHFAFQLAEHDSLEQISKIKLLNEQNNLLITKQALAETKIRNVQLGIAILILLMSILSIWGTHLWRVHKRVKILSQSDELTGIYNRRHFNYVAVSAIRYCKTAQQDLSVIMFDLDHFKKINDNHGHICGDWALKETIKVCQAIGKSNDVFARLGGEEFCLLLPSTNIDKAYSRAEACRIAIESIVSKTSGTNFSLTASFGVTDLKRSGFRLTDLLKDADSAMYIAKNTGRNQVMLFEPPNKEKSLDNSWSITS